MLCSLSLLLSLLISPAHRMQVLSPLSASARIEHLIGFRSSATAQITHRRHYKSLYPCSLPVSLPLYHETLGPLQ